MEPYPQFASAAVRLREIPYNYTSFSDREIVVRLLGQPAWELLNALRSERVTRSEERRVGQECRSLWSICH